MVLHQKAGTGQYPFRKGNAEMWLNHALIIILGSILGTGGFWKFLDSRSLRKNAQSQLMMGLAYKEITTLGIQYIDRGWITRDELEEFEKYYVIPYKKLGGNGIAERIANQVRNLPFHSHAHHDDVFRNEGYLPNVPVVVNPRGRQDAAA